MMNAAAPITLRGQRIVSLNRALATMLHTDPATLALGAEAAQRDELVFCGVLGGKDVGKSTLINALAGAEISIDRGEAGRGTERPVVYAHQAMESAVAERLCVEGIEAGLVFAGHEIAALRGVVLIDFPDFDSEFLEHRDIVSRLTPRLDRIIWVLTPRKLGDRAWVSTFREAVKDPDNVYFVLNKLDDLLADADPFDGQARRGGGDRAAGFRRRQFSWLMESVGAVGGEVKEERCFVFAAGYPDEASFVRRIGERWDDPDWLRFGEDRTTVAEVASLAAEDLQRLRQTVLSPLSRARARDIKEGNRSAELTVNADRIRRHFELDQLNRQLQQVCDPEYQQEILNEAFGAEFMQRAAERLLPHLRSPGELADELLARRVERWPLLPLVYWPFGWISRLLGRRAGGRQAAIEEGEGARGAMGLPAELGAGGRGAGAAVVPWDDVLAFGGRTLTDRLGLLRSRLLADHAAAVQRLALEGDVPEAGRLAERVEHAVRRLPGAFEHRLLERLLRKFRRPGLFKRAGLWLILLWFPLLQPLLSALVMTAQFESWRAVLSALLTLLLALTASHVLMSLGVVVLIYLAILAAMYVRGLRAVRTAMRPSKARSSALDVNRGLAEAVDQVFVEEALLPLMDPFLDRRQRLEAALRELDAPVEGVGDQGSSDGRGGE